MAPKIPLYKSTRFLCARPDHQYAGVIGKWLRSTRPRARCIADVSQQSRTCAPPTGRSYSRILAMLTSMSDNNRHANPSQGQGSAVRPMLTCGNFWTFSLVANPESEILQPIGQKGESNQGQVAERHVCWLCDDAAVLQGSKPRH
jgi:hypothetical protein